MSFVFSLDKLGGLVANFHDIHASRQAAHVNVLAVPAGQPGEGHALQVENFERGLARAVPAAHLEHVAIAHHAQQQGGAVGLAGRHRLDAGGQKVEGNGAHIVEGIGGRGRLRVAVHHVHLVARKVDAPHLVDDAGLVAASS